MHWWWTGSLCSLNCLGDRRIDGQKRGIPETRSGRYSLDPGWYQWYPYHHHYHPHPRYCHHHNWNLYHHIVKRAITIDPISPWGWNQGNQGKKHLFSNGYISRTKWLRYLNWVIFCENLILGPFLRKSLPPGVQEKLGGRSAPPQVIKCPKTPRFYRVKAAAPVT